MNKEIGCNCGRCQFCTEPLIEKIALIFGWTNERVQLTPYVKIMRNLVTIVEDYEKIIQMQKDVNAEKEKKIDYLEKHIKFIENINKDNLVIKRGLYDKSVVAENKLGDNNILIEAIEELIGRYQK